MTYHNSVVSTFKSDIKFTQNKTKEKRKLSSLHWPSCSTVVVSIHGIILYSKECPLYVSAGAYINEYRRMSNSNNFSHIVLEECKRGI